MKKSCRFFVLILLVFSMLCSASCGSEEKKTDFIYEITGDYATVIGYSGVENEIEIPRTLGGKTVKKIAENAFRGMIGLKKVTIPDTVAEIDYAFIECPDLVSVNIGSGVLTMNGAFKDCPKLETVYGGKNATELTEAFINCVSLSTGYIPATATACSSAFRGCTAMKTAKIEEGITSLPSTFEGCSALTEVTLPLSVTEASSTFENCSALTKVNGCTSLTVLNNTFSGCSSLVQISLGENVKILSGAFINCSALTAVDNLPTEVESYSPSFSGCTSLAQIIIPKMPDDEAKIYDLASDVKGLTALRKVTVLSPSLVTGEFCTVFEGCSSISEVIIPDETAKEFLRVNATYSDSIYKGSASKVTNAVKKSKQASSVIVSKSFGVIDGKKYTHISGGDVDFFTYDKIAEAQDVLNFKPFTKSYYWCGYPDQTNRKTNTVGIERTYSFYLRVSGINTGTLPATVAINGVKCIIEVK